LPIYSYLDISIYTAGNMNYSDTGKFNVPLNYSSLAQFKIIDWELGFNAV